MEAFTAFWAVALTVVEGCMMQLTVRLPLLLRRVRHAVAVHGVSRPMMGSTVVPLWLPALALLLFTK